MIVVRPVRLGDLPHILALASMADFGLSSLPADLEFLKETVESSLRGFGQIAGKPGGETYLFVMEDLSDHSVIGTSGIVSKVGGFEPFYAYRIETGIVESEVLKVRKPIQSLHLVEEHSGPCEIGSLFLNPRRQGRGLGRLLSRSRFLFMAEHPDFFETSVIAEMRGVIDPEGRSPFWEAIGRHFFEMDLPRADYLSMKNKKLIAELMPRHPIYVPMLPPEARRVVGRVHDKTGPALRLLRAEGFSASGMVDIFEGGPVVQCDRDEIWTVKHSRRASLEQISDGEPEGRLCLVCPSGPDFRVLTVTVGTASGGGLLLGRAAAEALGVTRGDTLRYAPMAYPAAGSDPG